MILILPQISNSSRHFFHALWGPFQAHQLQLLSPLLTCSTVFLVYFHFHFLIRFIIIIIIIIIIIGLPLESEWRQVFSDLQDSSQFSVRC